MIRERINRGGGRRGIDCVRCENSEVTRPVTMPQYRGLRNGLRDIEDGRFLPSSNGVFGVKIEHRSSCMDSK